jgi:hypothetical protein
MSTSGHYLSEAVRCSVPFSERMIFLIFRDRTSAASLAIYFLKNKPEKKMNNNK